MKSYLPGKKIYSCPGRPDGTFFNSVLDNRRFHGRGRHLGSGANAVKFSDCMGKIVILMLDNSRKVDILKFL